MFRWLMLNSDVIANKEAERMGRRGGVGIDAGKDAVYATVK